MDGVSAAASIAGIATLAGQLSKSLFQICRDVKEAEKDISDVANNVQLLEAVLDELKNVFQQDQYTPAPVYRPKLVKCANEICGRCKQIFQDVEEATGIQSRRTPKPTLIAKLKWCFEKSRVNLLQSSLESLKSTLNILLQLITVAKSNASYTGYIPLSRRDKRILMENVIENWDLGEALEKLERLSLQPPTRTRSEEFLDKLVLNRQRPDQFDIKNINGVKGSAPLTALAHDDSTPAQPLASKRESSQAIQYSSDDFTDINKSATLSSQEQDSEVGQMDFLRYQPKTSALIRRAIPCPQNQVGGTGGNPSKSHEAEEVVRSLVRDYTQPVSPVKTPLDDSEGESRNETETHAEGPVAETDIDAKDNRSTSSRQASPHQAPPHQGWKWVPQPRSNPFQNPSYSYVNGPTTAPTGEYYPPYGYAYTIPSTEPTAPNTFNGGGYQPGYYPSYPPRSDFAYQSQNQGNNPMRRFWTLPPEQARQEPKPAEAGIRETIKFKDAVGRNFTWPWKTCKTWKGIDDLIQQAFVHVDDIGERVALGHFDLVGPEGEIILPRVWEDSVEPGWSITMHMWPMAEKKTENESKQPEDRPGTQHRDGVRHEATNAQPSPERDTINIVSKSEPSEPPGASRNEGQAQAPTSVEWFEILNKIVERTSVSQVELQRLQEQYRELEVEHRLHRAREDAKREALDALRVNETSQSPHPAVVPSKPLILKDFLNRSFEFPFETCKSWETMRNLIESSFTHLDTSRDEIKGQNYDLFKSSGDIILPEVWEAVVQPGWVVELRIRSWSASSSKSARQLDNFQDLSSLANLRSNVKADRVADDKASQDSRSRRSVRAWLKRQKASSKGYSADERER